MSSQILYIKNMVCQRCEEAVRETLERHGIEVQEVKLGEATVTTLDEGILIELDKALKERGFELVQHAEKRLVEQIKAAVIEMIRDETNPAKNSEYLSKKLRKSYSSLSKTFSHNETITIERYMILQKIERVKELLSYDELSGKEIAYRLGYSSLQHLSGQFKTVTGMSITEFREKSNDMRKPLDAL